jgi:type I restriction enzyme S subunit
MKLPQDWKRRQFDEVASIQEGQVSPLIEPYRSMIHVGPDSIRPGGGLVGPLKSCQELALTSGKYLFKAGAIVYSKIRPNLNKVYLVDFEGVCSADAYPIYSKRDLIESEFMLHTMRSGYFVRQAIGVSMRSGMPKINREDLGCIELVLPPLTEQRKIAEILSTWDEALEKLDALIEVKERSKKALMQQLLTGRLRFKGFSQPWLTTKLGTLFTERVEQGRADLPLLSITADRGIVPREDVAKRDSSSEDKSKYLRIVPGDIGYNTMRMWQGVSALSTLEGIVSPAYTICTPTDRIDGRFAAHFFKFKHTVHLFHRYSQGLVDDTLNLKFPNFAVIEVTIPSDIEEQRKIAAILDTSDQELTILRTQRKALNQQKRGLMQRLLTGKIRVNIS